jgi:hypothetical protein
MSNQNTSQLYPANFDDSSFNKYKKNEMNRLSEDACYNNQKDLSNNKKLKFVTTNHIDLLKAKEELNFFGIGVRDQLFVPGEQIDTYSDLLNGKNGQTLTNCNVRNGFGALPMPTTPYRGQLQHGDVDIEDKIRNNIEVRKNACLPRDSNFEKRSFTIFDDSQQIFTPNAMKSVETPDIGFSLGRNGVASRFTKKFNTTTFSSSGTNFKPHSS